MSGNHGSWISAGLVGVAVWVVAGPAAAQTWVTPATRPILREIVAVDATGAARFGWAAEDVSGDGVDTFGVPEQSIDARTAYAVTGDGRLWVRIYFASNVPPADTVTGFVFIDGDLNSSTGGPGMAADIAGEFVSDPSSGGYERLLVVHGDESLPDVWQWSDAVSTYERVTPVNASNSAAEVGTDRDPFVVAGTGYIQASVNLDLVGLSAACSAEFYFRSTSGDSDLGPGDLEIGEPGRCIPGDGDADHVPDVVEPPDCDSNDDCPAGGECLSGECVFPVECRDADDCEADEDCTDFVCVPRPSGACTDASDCDELACVNGQCVPCDDDRQCGSGRVCGPDGRCWEATNTGTGGATSGPDVERAGSEGIDLEEGEEVRGGACKCSTPERWSNGSAAWLSLLGLPLLRRRRGRRG